MKSELLDRMADLAVTVDTETGLILPGLLVPPLVCGSSAWRMSDGNLDSMYYDTDQTREQIRYLLQSDSVIGGANLPYDFAVCAHDALQRGEDILPLIFDKYERGEVFDVLQAEMVDAIGRGTLGKDPRDGGHLRNLDGTDAKRYSLEIVCDHVLGLKTAKANDRWRKRYWILRDVPMIDWPADALQYLCDDAQNPLRVMLAQCGLIPRADGTMRRATNLQALSNECYTAFCLHLGAAWGLRADPTRYEAFRREAEEKSEQGRELFERHGFVYLGNDGEWHSKKAPLARAVAVAYGADDAVPCDACNPNNDAAEPGRIPSRATGGKTTVACSACGGTGLHLPPTVPRTDGGKSGVKGVSAARDVLEDSDDPVLVAFADHGKGNKDLHVYAPFIEPATRGPLCLRPNTPLATFRVSYGGDDRGDDAGTKGIIQQMKRKGGARGCFRPRDGYYYFSVDYEGAESCSHAQNLKWTVGWSRQLDCINESGKPGWPIAIVGGLLFGSTPQEFEATRKDKKHSRYKFACDCRQASKAAVYGFPGRMGPAKLVKAKRKEDTFTVGPDGRRWPGLRFCIMLGGESVCGRERTAEWNRQTLDVPLCVRCLEVATELLRPTWLKAFPEHHEYFRIQARKADDDGYIVHHVDQTIRAGVDGNQAANGPFQNLSAQAGKAAYRRIARECWDSTRRSPLFGTRLIAFFHDELFGEVPIPRAHDAMMRMKQVMIEEGRRFMPDVIPVGAEPALMRDGWDKDAEAVYIAGQLVPWEMREAA